MSKTESYPVNVRVVNPETGEKENKQVGTATYAVYDTVAEAVDALGEEKVRELVNAQVRTNELNRVRGLSRPGGISKTLLKNKALTRITQAEWQEVAGDEAAINALIENKMEQIKAEMESEAGIDNNDD